MKGRSRSGATLHFVKRGESILITDRNKPVAQLTPVGETNEIVSRLIAEGVELPAEGPPLDVEKLFSLVDQLCHWNGIFRRLLLFDIHSTIMANYHHDQDAGSDSR